MKHHHYKKQNGSDWDIIEVGQKISATEYKHKLVATFYTESKADEYLKFINQLKCAKI